MAIPWGPIAIGGATLASSLLGKKKNKNQYITPPEYKGQRPYSGSDVGYGADTMKSLADAYIPELKKRAMGEGFVGYDPKYSEMKKQSIDADLNYQRELDTEQMQGQASGQGLRGGIPMTLAERYATNFQRNRQNAMNNIDIADLEARRTDINNAFYQQPEEISRGAGIQQNRANFDLAEYNAEMPTYIDEPSLAPSMISAGGDIVSSMLGNKSGLVDQEAMDKILPQLMSLMGKKQDNAYLGDAERKRQNRLNGVNRSMNPDLGTYISNKYTTAY